MLFLGIQNFKESLILDCRCATSRPLGPMIVAPLRPGQRPMFVFVFHEPFRTSRTSWDHGPLFSRALSGSHETQTHTKRNKKTKKFFCFVFCLCFMNHSGLRGPRGIPLFPPPSSTLRCHELQTQTKKDKKCHKTLRGVL
jgi:hypothetical protein